ncbi:restriction endonuclease subunit S [Enterococcus rivorum]|uniref:Type I restriction modification DNA specificity domain-containing protein n=1 Tax=Enterococcus rivorum TaxID=762845 RepID=A0A1E5KWD0_9ENTE|nr:restriction endonuclease subunit S [Enterococcus rivorum]MBP2100085.1 type I restriction enzyme S subunit [Enterococcus rivorum]OEH82128.1 hypothetical protein BCR26_14425 [Enterococcus rivorum]
MRKAYLYELGSVITGNTPPKKKKEYYMNSDISFVKPDDLPYRQSINFLNNSKCYISFCAKDKARIAPKKSILVTCIGIIGKIAIVNKNEVAFNQQINAIIPNEKVIDHRYLAYLLLFNRKKLNFIANAPIVPIINKSDFSNFKVKIHDDIMSQQKIADSLDLASSLIEKRKEQLEAMDQLIQSVFYEMFGDPVVNDKNWEMFNLSNLGELGRGVSKHRPRNDEKLLGGEYPLIQTGDIANSYIYIYDYKSTYSKLGLEQSKLWRKGTLCITIAANIAKTGILTFNSCFPDSVVGFIANEKTNSIFINVWFSFFQEIIENSAPESAQKNINLKILSNLSVIAPPIDLQNKFASIVEEIEAQKKVMEESLQEMENNFNALMQKAFKGELFPE